MLCLQSYDPIVFHILVVFYEGVENWVLIELTHYGIIIFIVTTTDINIIWLYAILNSGAASVHIQSIHWIPSKARLWLYFKFQCFPCRVFNVDLWQDFSDAILLFLCKNRHFLGCRSKYVSIQNSIWILLLNRKSFSIRSYFAKLWYFTLYAAAEHKRIQVEFWILTHL